MSFETWLEAVIDGRKGDVLTLFALNILTDMHIYVHLHDNGHWTTLKYVPSMHEDITRCCDVHLLYLGCGLYIELTERKSPLEIVDNPDPHVKLLVIGELTAF